MYINDFYIREAGFVFDTEEEKKAFMETVEQEVEMRVGKKLYKEINNNDKICDFLKIRSPDGVREWLRTNYPEYEDIVSECISDVLQEIKDSVMKQTGIRE